MSKSEQKNRLLEKPVLNDKIKPILKAQEKAGI